MNTSGDAPGPRAQGASAPNGANGRKHAPEGGRPTEALGDLGAYLADLKDQATLLVAAKVDGIKASARRILLWAVAGLLGLVLLAVTVAGAAIYLFSGIAGGLSRLFGDSPWLGDLAAGVVLLGFVAFAVGFGSRMWSRASAKATMRKYEERSSARQSRSRVPHEQPRPTDAH